MSDTDSNGADYTGYKPCGHPEYRNTDAGPQPNDCGCDDSAGSDGRCPDHGGSR